MKKSMVYGAGVSGIGAQKLLEKTGYQVFLVDDKLEIKTDDALELVGEMDVFVKSPGIPYNRLVKRAIESGIELIDEVELAYRYLKQNKPTVKIVGVTGTNGKTTTTTKIQELLEYCGKKACVAGNIGKSFAELVCEGFDYDYIVLELSSYQLENIKEFKPDVAMIINLTPDHLNRYDNLDGYYQAKFNILKNQVSDDTFVLNCGSKDIVDRFDGYSAGIIKVCNALDDGADYYVDGDFIKYRGMDLLETSRLGLAGKHNQENVLFILAVAGVFKLPEAKVREFLYSTKPLEHRMEKFFQYGEVEFINDSKGTNIDSTIKALEGYNEKIILICGGKDKKLDLSPLAEKISDKVKEVFLIGETADILEKYILSSGYSGEIHKLRELEKVVGYLKTELDPEIAETVLFSPASSSFDQFKNFEIRGRYFKELILKTFEK